MKRAWYPVVGWLMYRCGALAWYQRECDDLRWLWEVGKERNELVRGESGWSTFRKGM